MSILKKNNVKLKSNIPAVVFNDEKLQIAIGQWLGILSMNQSIETYLLIQDIMKKCKISSNIMNEIEIEFATLLKMILNSDDGICTMDQFDRENHSFIFHYNKDNTDYKVSLIYGDIYGGGKELIIEANNKIATYAYYESNKEDPATIKLKEYIITNPRNGSACNITLSKSNVFYMLYAKDYLFVLDINTDVPNNDGVTLKNEVDLQQYLLDLTFPIDICEVYKKICEITTNLSPIYPSFIIEVRRLINNKPDKTTDKIYLVKGKLKIFTITKNGKTITVDGGGNWTFNSDKLTITQNDGKINYNLDAASTDDLSKIDSLLDQYVSATQDVDDVIELSKKMIKTKED